MCRMEVEIVAPRSARSYQSCPKSHSIRRCRKFEGNRLFIEKRTQGGLDLGLATSFRASVASEQRENASQKNNGLAHRDIETSTPARGPKALIEL